MRLLTVVLLSLLLTGCFDATPGNVLARWAARKWVEQRLHPTTLRVQQLRYAGDRAVVTLRADRRLLTLRLRKRDGEWQVVR